MNKWSILILCAFLPLVGCQSASTDTSSEDQYDSISREIERLKAESEAAVSTGQNIKVVVNLLTTSVADHFTLDSLWQYADRNVTITKRPEMFTRSGLRIGLAGKNFRARLDIAKRQLKSSEDTELFIVFADGSSGFINIGKEIYVPRFYYSGRWYTAIDYEFRHAGRSLKVTARKLPSGLIDMELTPVFSKFLNTGGNIELTELSTRVMASPGQTLVIGGGDSSEQNVATALLGYSKHGEKRRTLITVTPYIR